MRDKIVEDKLKELDLVKYRDVASVNLSGGNKRKLSTAIATLGNFFLLIIIHLF